MLKLVIDTNVVISALLKPESNPALIMSLVLRGNCTHTSIVTPGEFVSHAVKLIE